MSCPRFVAVLNSNHGGSFLSCPWEELGVFCSRHQKAGMRMELPLCWPGRRGAPSELSSRFPLLSPAPAAPYMGSPFPLSTRPYSNLRGLRLPQHLFALKHPSHAAWVVLQSWPLLGHGATTPAHPRRHLPSSLPCPPTAQGLAMVGKAAFVGLNLFTALIAPQNPHSLAGALHGCYLFSCLFIGVGAADLLFFGLCNPLQNLLEVF